MPFPQYQEATFVDSGTFVQVSMTELTAVYQSSSGEVDICSASATGGVVKLPPVATGGPVIVNNIGADALTVKSFEVSGVNVNGTAGSTGVSVAAGTILRLASDGSNWWTI